MSVERQTGIKPKELENLVQLPDTCRHVWNWFIELSNTRNSSFALAPISYTEIKAYFELIEIKPKRWELRLLRTFDSVYMEQANKK